jgi:nitrogen fixation protein NifB
MRADCYNPIATAIPEELRLKTARHPCYSFAGRHQYARMHLPVAPECNISCNYCNRKFDCVNESRPGVTSEVLTPEQACAKFLRVRQEMPNLTVVGIAGPGDALANWAEVKRTINLIRAEAPEPIFCLSTNGLMLPHYGAELVELGLKHVTVTVNSINPVIGAALYHHINYEGKYYTRERAAEILIKNQLAGIKFLAEQGVLVKVNMVLINDINASHLLEVVKKVKRQGALMGNIMPLIPAAGSAFGTMPQTSMKDINALREICRADLPQMSHCQQCRADAIGLLDADQSYQYRMCAAATTSLPQTEKKAYKVAVTSKYRKLVDLHYGRAEEFHIYMVDGSQSTFVETRRTGKYCAGPGCDETDDLKGKVIKMIHDCDAVLTMRIGSEAQKRLQENGIFCFESCVSVEEGLVQLFQKMAQSA